MSAFSSARLERCSRSMRATSVCTRVSSSSSRRTSCRRAVARALIQLRELEDARGESDVLEVKAQLLVGAIVGGVGAADLRGDLLPARARGVARAARVLGRGTPARVQRSPGRERLPHAEHQRLRLIERVGARQRHAPLLVLELGIGQPRRGPAARVRGARPRVGSPRRRGFARARRAGWSPGARCDRARLRHRRALATCAPARAACSAMTSQGCRSEADERIS